MPAITITGAGGPGLGALADLGVIRAVAAGEAVSLDAELLAAVQERCDQARQVLRDGRPVYGVNTGMGRCMGSALPAHSSSPTSATCCRPARPAGRRGWISLRP